MRLQQLAQFPSEEHIRKLVKDQMAKSFNQFWITHSTSGITHIPAIAESAWHYMALPPSRSPTPNLRETDASSVSETETPVFVVFVAASS